MKKHFLVCLLLLTVATALAAPAPPTVRAEINVLLDKLQTSGCEFNRNGTWHTAIEAKAHLLRKLEHLEGLIAVLSTEQFIDHAASKSSSTGKPYLIKCGAVAPMESGKWLTTELNAIRAAGISAVPADK